MINVLKSHKLKFTSERVLSEGHDDYKTVLEMQVVICFPGTDFDRELLAWKALSLLTIQQDKKEPYIT